MKKLFLAAGVAALAITAPAVADPGKNERGKGRDRGAMKIERGGGGGERAQKVREKRAEAAKKSREQRVERAKKSREMRAERAKKGNEFAKKAREQRVEQAKKRNERSFEARKRIAEQREKAFEQRAKRLEKRAERRRDRLDDLRVRNFDSDRFAQRGRVGFANDCPPGLSKVPGECMPWGQYKKDLVGRRLPTQLQAQVLPAQLKDLYLDTDDYYFRFNKGYLYKVDRDEQLIQAVLPLIGAGLGIGMPFPFNSPRYQVPIAYQPFYLNTDNDYHRYANGYVYEIDGDTGLIEDMFPLLDQGHGVGQMLPASFSYYNLPFQYRSYYKDDDDYLYRYAPGAIYQVDRETQLITAIVSLLTGTNNGLAVGQPLPMGYSAYNVPMAFRDQYYDTPDSWYRYANGNIYQVDPTTRLITAVIDAIV